MFVVTLSLLFNPLFHLNAALAHSSATPIQEDSLVVTVAPSSTVNRGQIVTVTATVLVHRTGAGTMDTNWSIQLTVPAGYSITSGANPQAKTTSKHGSAAATWQLSTPVVPTSPATFTVTASAADSILGTALLGSPEIDTFTLSTVNRSPVANSDSVTITEDTPAAVINVLSNDTDADGDALTISSISSAPLHGNAQIINSNTQVVYSPNANFFGTDTLAYTIQDGYGGTAESTLTILVTAVNDAPIANDDYVTTDEDVNKTISVLDNDFDVDDGDSLVVEIVNAPTSGQVQVNENGTVTYAPYTNFNGEDMFDYKLSDGHGEENIASVFVNVGVMNDPPIALSQDGVETREDESVEIVLEATDVDSDELTFTVILSPVHGELEEIADGIFTYTPAENFNGNDSFTFQSGDGLDNSNIAIVNITILPVNDAPIAADDAYLIDEDSILTVSGLGVVSNDIDNENDHADLSASLVDDVLHGNLTLYLNGSFSYAPYENYNGFDSFTYTINDGELDSSDIATVSIEISAINDTPSAGNVSLTVDEDQQVVIHLQADDMGDDDLLTFFIFTEPLHGSLTQFDASTGSVLYSPTRDYNGQDSFQFLVNDGTVNSTIATVSIVVSPIEEQEEPPDNDNDDPDRESIGNNKRDDEDEQELASQRITYEDSHFDDKPLERVQLQSNAIVNANGATFASVEKGEKVTLSYAFRNYQQATQPYHFIVEIVDGNDMTIALQFESGELVAGGKVKIDQTWIPQDSGTYTVKVFIWDYLEMPTPLADKETSSVIIR